MTLWKLRFFSQNDSAKIFSIVRGMIIYTPQKRIISISASSRRNLKLRKRRTRPRRRPRPRLPVEPLPKDSPPARHRRRQGRERAARGWGWKGPLASLGQWLLTGFRAPQPWKGDQASRWWRARTQTSQLLRGARLSLPWSGAWAALPSWAAWQAPHRMSCPALGLVHPEGTRLSPVLRKKDRWPTMRKKN